MYTYQSPSATSFKNSYRAHTRASDSMVVSKDVTFSFSHTTHNCSEIWDRSLTHSSYASWKHNNHGGVWASSFFPFRILDVYLPWLFHWLQCFVGQAFWVIRLESFLVAWLDWQVLLHPKWISKETTWCVSRRPSFANHDTIPQQTR